MESETGGTVSRDATNDGANERNARETDLSELVPSLEALDGVEIPLLASRGNLGDIVLALVDDELSAFNLLEDLRARANKERAVSEDAARSTSPRGRRDPFLNAERTSRRKRRGERDAGSREARPTFDSPR